MYLYHLGAGTVPSGGNLTFDATPVPAVPSAPISLPNNQTVRISATGFYEVLFHTITVQQGRRVELRINGTSVPGGVFSDFTSGTSIDGKLIVEITSAQLPADITLANVSGSQIDYSLTSTSDVTAMITVIKLA